MTGAAESGDDVTGVVEAAALPDRFEVRGLLGRGGMGVVVRAHDRVLGRDVAVKILVESLRGDEDLERRLLREARAAAALKHPGIVAVHDVEPSAGYIVMELVEGVSLAQSLAEHGPLSAFEARRVGLALLDALAAAHGAGIVHRDVKPSNVLLTSTGEIKLGDFGIAHLDDGELTRPGSVFGTPGYMAPEQARGRADTRSDVYSAGATLFEAATGRRLHGPEGDAEDVEGELRARTKDAAFARAIAIAVSPRPDDRFASAAELRDALTIGRVVARTPVEWLRARSGSVVASVVLALAAGAAAGAWAGDRPRAASPPEAREPLAEEDEAVVAVPRVAVVPFLDRTGDGRLDFASMGLAQLLADEVRRAGAEVLGPHRLVRLTRAERPTQEALLAAARSNGADRWIIGQLLPTDTGVLVDVAVTIDQGEASGAWRVTRECSAEEASNTLRAAIPEIVRATLQVEGAPEPQAPRPFDLDRSVQLGRAALERHDLGTAEEHFLEAVEADPHSTDARYYLAVVGWWAGRPPERIEEHVRVALEGDLEEGRRGFLEGLLLFVRERYRDALRAFEALARRYPDERDVIYGLFEARFHGGRPADAMRAFWDLKRLAPDLELGYFHALDYYGTHGDVEQYERTLRSSPSWGGGALPRADLAIVGGRHEEALELLDAQIESETTDVAVRSRTELQLALLLIVLGEVERAEPVVAGLHRWGSSAATLYAYALAAARGVPAAELRRARETALAGIRTQANSHGRFYEFIAFMTVDAATLTAADAVPLLRLKEELSVPGVGHDSRATIVKLILEEAAGDLERSLSDEERAFPEVAAVERAMEAEEHHRWFEAVSAWAEAFTLSADGTFAAYEGWRGAGAAREAGHPAEVIEACRAVVLPPRLRTGTIGLLRPCLEMTAEAHDRREETELAAAIRARLARLR